jgi:hypothetical protein
MLNNVYGRILNTPRPRALLEALATAGGGVRYAEARKRLELQGLAKHPQEFQRALDTLMHAGLVEGRVLPKGERTDSRRRVLLEATLLGKVLWRYETLKIDALEQAAGEFGVTVEQLQLEAT